MKWLRTMMLFLAISAAGTAAATAQCESDEFLDKCASTLDRYTFVKAFNLSSESSRSRTSEFSYVFSKGSSYLIVICDQEIRGRRMVLNLYDRNHSLIASSYNKKTKKHYPDLLYPCPATGVYHMEAVFEGSGPSCGVVILGFDKGN